MTPTTIRDPVLCPDSNIGLVCLPPMSDDLQLIWTQAELTNELDEHQQLLHTFSYFPYPSMPEIALLCLRYGLQMEKVKTWFMVQRIRCGISWSSEEIEETRSRLLYNQDQLHFEPLVAFAKKSSIFRTPEKLKVPSPKNDEMQEMTTSQTSPCLDHPVPKAKRIKTECMTPESETLNATKHKMHSSDRKWDPSETQQELRHSPSVPGDGQMFGVDGTEVSTATACLPSEEELFRRGSTSFCKPEGFSPLQDNCFQEQSRGSARGDSYMPVTRRQRKTKEQLAILKSFFVKCQWAAREDYKKLAEITGLPRTEIIQWFGDTRYALKHGQLKWFRESAQEHPSWLDEPQYVIFQNGKQSESMPQENHLLIPVTGEPGANNRSTVQSIKNTGPRGFGGSPVTQKTAAIRSINSVKFLENSPEIKDGKRGASSGPVLQKSPKTVLLDDSGAGVQYIDASGSEYHLPPKSLQTMKKNLSSPSHVQTSSQKVKYYVLEKSNEPAEVEVLLDVEEEGYVVEVIEGEEDDDVIIQD
ncbi:homeobox and leucine zipper protein Homez isoform X1 [Xenopus tropicalis]|uniref:Homeobox and leucine zipper encoding n=1 Tax=Xenopus tropicalis TaxID=8364 RepID=A0A803JL01_XENTR|nr:homeobox and leucine zipper protein Homez isoform X1 [Xenopus tropicalis]XP_017946958.2 homeobox and leucine zipper protein Homez isoform X1 [Xenopus tropicalis]